MIKILFGDTKSVHTYFSSAKIIYYTKTCPIISSCMKLPQEQV